MCLLSECMMFGCVVVCVCVRLCVCVFVRVFVHMVGRVCVVARLCVWLFDWLSSGMSVLMCCGVCWLGWPIV